MPQDKVHDEANEAEAVEGAVVVDSPDAVAVLLTPEAADETAKRLEDSAQTAGHQELSD